MSKSIEKQKALNLRKLGMSYGQIKSQLSISKSTLSLWLRKYPLKKEQIRLLRDVNEKRIEKYRETMRKKKNERIETTKLQMKKTWNHLTERDFEIAGLFLYWGEGNKAAPSSISLSNTDAQMLIFFKIWLMKIFNVSQDRFKIYLHLYDDMNIEKELAYWSSVLSIPQNQFSKPYIKESKLSNISHKGFGHGTCNMTINDTRLKEKIIGSLNAVIELELKRS